MLPRNQYEDDTIATGNVSVAETLHVLFRCFQRRWHRSLAFRRPEAPPYSRWVISSYPLVKCHSLLLLYNYLSMNRALYRIGKLIIYISVHICIIFFYN